jgi:hypothetical protein
MFYPRARHGLGGDHYNQLMVDFITESLGIEADRSHGESGQ